VADGRRIANRSLKEDRSQHAVKRIDIDPPYHTVADGDGQTTTAWDAASMWVATQRARSRQTKLEEELQSA
jgi:hypothetical protein